MFFAIDNLGMLSASVGKFRSLVIQTPDPYVGTDPQVKILENKAFDLFKKKGDAIYLSQVCYAGHEKILNTPATEGMEPDIVIEGAQWI